MKYLLGDMGSKKFMILRKLALDSMQQYLFLSVMMTTNRIRDLSGFQLKIDNYSFELVR